MSARTEAEFDFEICNRKILPIAEALVKKYDELHHVDPAKILFVTNFASADGKKQMSLAKTSKIPPKWTEILFQLGGGSYFYMIEFYWWQMLMGLGRKWFYPDRSCPNLLDDGVDWKKLMGAHYEEPKD